MRTSNVRSYTVQRNKNKEEWQTERKEGTKDERKMKVIK
jgi:hypothetical protein